MTQTEPHLTMARAQIGCKILTQPVICDRILTMRRVLIQNQQDPGYVALCAARKL